MPGHARCRLSECHGRSVHTRKLWHSTRFVSEPRCGGGCPAIHKPNGALGKLFFPDRSGLCARVSGEATHRQGEVVACPRRRRGAAPRVKYYGPACPASFRFRPGYIFARHESRWPSHAQTQPLQHPTACLFAGRYRPAAAGSRRTRG